MIIIPSTRVYNWSTILANDYLLLASPSTISVASKLRMHADSNQYHQTYRKHTELSIIGLRLTWKYIDKAWIPATFSLHQPIERTHTHSPLAQNVSQNILIMWETYFEFMSYFILDLETCLGMSGQHHPQFYLHCWIRVRMQIWLRLRLLRQLLLLTIIMIIIRY